LKCPFPKNELTSNPLLEDSGEKNIMPETAANKKKFESLNKKTLMFSARVKPSDRAKQFFVCVDGAYTKDGRTLHLKRSTEPLKGCWHLVGGHVEANETLREALRREFREETNLNVEIGKIIGGRIEETFDRIKIIVEFEITSAKGEIKLNSENEAYGWFEKSHQSARSKAKAFNQIYRNQQREESS
jgi:ADP-ribose pyrophosphatase YjhB (NUDIX family)